MEVVIDNRFITTQEQSDARNRSDLAAGAVVTHVDGFGERHAAIAMLDTVPGSAPRMHFGWGKTMGHIRQTVYRGIRRVDHRFKLTMAMSNLVRRGRMMFAVPQGAIP